jgi:hypothetical protein
MPTEATVRRAESDIVQPAINERAPDPFLPVAALRAATMSTLDGDVITHGVAELRGTADAWAATMTCLDQPGAVAIAYFAQRIREVIFSLNDGRSARARLSGTSFADGSQRVCDLQGLEPLTHIATA